MTPVVAIVGAGVAGLSAAVAASRAGAEVVVLEREHVAAGSSSLSVGTISRANAEPSALEVRIRGAQVIEDLVAEGALSFQRVGVVKPILRASDLGNYERSLAQSRELGFTTSHIITREELSRRFPNIRCDDFEAAIFSPQDGHIDGHQLCGALAEKARSQGATIRTNTALVGRTASSRGHRHRLVTTAGDVECDVVMNAAGAWAERVGEVLGVRVPIVSQRHQTVLVRPARPVDYTVPFFAEHLVGGGEALYFREDQNHELVAGLHSSEFQTHLEGVDPDDYKRAVDDDFIVAVAQQFNARFTDAGEPGFAPGWTGIYPMSPDGEFTVGPHREDPSVVACAGTGGIGITCAPILGELAAQWALDLEPGALSGADRFLPDRPSLKQVRSDA